MDRVLEKARILIVEDELVMADVLRTAFATRGWEVELAGGIAEAMRALSSSGSPDVILVDKNLPDGSGVELVRQVRARDPAVGVVLMTAYGTVESARDTLNLGVDAYLEKPFTNVFTVVGRMDELRVRARARRPAARNGQMEPLTVIVAAADPVRRALIALRLREGHHRIIHVERPDDLRPAAKNEKADLLILDGKSYPAEVTCLVAEVKARARRAACVVLSEALTLDDVKRLIQLEVKALIDHPIDSERFGGALTAAVDRVRKSRA